jgi:hypothetical protein
MNGRYREASKSLGWTEQRRGKIWEFLDRDRYRIVQGYTELFAGSGEVTYNQVVYLKWKAEGKHQQLRRQW